MGQYRRSREYLCGVILDEPYLTEKALGDCDIELPYQVPESRYFCVGDHRLTSIDSRHTSIGCISEEQIIEKLHSGFGPFPILER